MARPTLHLPVDLRGHKPLAPIKNQIQANWPMRNTFRLRIYFDGLTGGEFALEDTINSGTNSARIMEIVMLTDTTGYLGVDTVVGTFADNDHFTDGTVGADVDGTPEIADWTCKFPRPVNYALIQARNLTQDVEVTLNPNVPLGPIGQEAIYGPFAKTLSSGDVYEIEGYVINEILFKGASQDDMVEVWGFIKPEFGGAYSHKVTQ